MDNAFTTLHPGRTLPNALKEAFVELHSLCGAKNDERRFRVMNAAADDMTRRTIAPAALAALSVPGPAGMAPNPWVHNVHFGQPQDVARYYRELAPITMPTKKLQLSGKYATLPLK